MNCPICQAKLELGVKGDKRYLLCPKCEKIICDFQFAERCKTCELRYGCQTATDNEGKWT